jgi:hypothetical protein
VRSHFCSYGVRNSEIRQNAVDVPESGCRRNMKVSVALSALVVKLLSIKHSLFQSLILQPNKQDKALNQRTGHTLTE